MAGWRSIYAPGDTKYEIQIGIESFPILLPYPDLAGKADRALSTFWLGDRRHFPRQSLLALAARYKLGEEE